MTGPMPFRLPKYADNRYAVQRRVGFSWLSFSPDLEQEYREQHPLLNPNRLRVAHFLALGMLFGFIMLDWFMGARIVPAAGNLILVAVTAPALAAPLIATYFVPAGIALQRVVFGSGLVLGLSVTAVVEVGRGVESWFPYEALILVIMYVYLVSGLLYFQAATVGLSMWLVFAICEEVWSPGSAERFVYESYFLFVANVVGLLGLYALQYEARKAFLMQNELKQEAMLDSLTGLFNRREFRRHFDAAWLQARRDQTSVGLLLVDLDNFKDINDSCGHVAGDSVLKLVAETLQSLAKRPLDAVGRYGGDEFVAVWFGPGEEWFRKLAADLPQRFDDLEVPGLRAAGCRIALSGGAVLAYPDQVLAPLDAIRLADRRLYEQKRAGGNIGFTLLKSETKGS